jgi:hypothetical protein
VVDLSPRVLCENSLLRPTAYPPPTSDSETPTNISLPLRRSYICSRHSALCDVEMQEQMDWACVKRGTREEEGGRRFCVGGVRRGGLHDMPSGIFSSRWFAFLDGGLV